jgi:thiol-disulfide isomerase/thioredoxin
VAATVIGGIIVARGQSGSATPIGVTPASSAPLSIEGRDPVTGREVSLASFRAKPIVLNVWGSWCTGCKAEARDLARFAATHPQAQVVGIDTQDTQGGARAFYLEYGWHHPSIYDPHGDIASQLGLQGTPTTFFLDRRHKVVAEIIGATTFAGFEQGLARALKS